MPYDPEEHGPERIVGPGFHGRVYDVVSRVPPGRVTTYGDVARVLGSVRVARHVGYALAALSDDRRDVPWHRVVDARGRIHDPTGRFEDGTAATQVGRLRAEGIEVDEEGRIPRLSEVRYDFEDEV